MKILLTCTTIEDNHRIEDAHDSHYPLGLGYLHSYLESLDKGYEIETRFLNNVSSEKCMSTLKRDLQTFQPDIIGISMMTHSRVGAFKFIEYIEEAYPNIKIVIGGMHVSVMYRQLVSHYKNIVCVIGEGEITMGELVERWDNELPIDDVRGIAYYDHEKKETIVTPERPLIDDLDILPFPKHDLFLWEGKTMAGLLTSRGCPYKCNFCVLDAASRRKVRCRSAKNIVDEVEQILTEHPTIDTVWIHDDAFMIIKERTIEFCKEVIRRGVKTNFVCSARFRPISREVVMLMKEAGFVHVLFGLESGAESVLKLMKKGLTQKTVRHGLKLFSETGIKATAFLIVGLPGETAETVEESIDFIQELQEIQYLYYDEIGVAGIYPGTELFTISKEANMIVPGYGVIDDDFWMTDNDVPWYEVDHTYEQLLEWKEQTRNAIALNRMLASPENFLKQRKLIPQIIEYSWRWGIDSIVSHTTSVLDQDRDLLYNMLRYSFLREIPTKEIQKICARTEKALLNAFFLTNKSMQVQKEFISKYEKQIREDKKTLVRWHATQEREQSGLDTKNNNYSKEVISKEGTMITPFADDGLDDERKRRPASRSLSIIQ
jgi:anaerobic magnesium-protoporphyrin IX monomethyl ester cyclase